MKKNILAILIITFILSITACSSKKKNTDDFSMTTYEEPTSGVTITYPGNFSEKEETVDGITFYTKGKKAKLEIYVTPNSDLDVETFLAEADYDSSIIKNQTEDSFDQDMRDTDSSYVVTALTSEYIVIAGIQYMDSEKDTYYTLCNDLSIKVPDDKKVGASEGSTNDSSDGSNDTADNSNDTEDSSNDTENGSTDTSDGSNSDESGKESSGVFTSDLIATKELLDTVLGYDSFTWGGASQKEKISMATNIISMFALVDGPIDKDAKALVTEIDQLMGNGDQLDVFEQACSIYGFEYSNYQNLANTLSTEGEDSGNEGGNSENASEDTNSTAKKPSSKLITRVLYYDIFDWQAADDAAKTVIATEMVELLTYYELAWNNINLEMNPQDFVDIINSDMENIGQDSLFNTICSKLGFDITPYQELANQ